MKTERFNDLVKEIREASLDTLTKKNANYATAEDRLHNFKVGAAITGAPQPRRRWGTWRSTWPPSRTRWPGTISMIGRI